MRRPTIPYLIGGSFLFLLLGLVVTVLIPAIQEPPASNLAVRYNGVQQQGRDQYIREGCWYCHTQQVRSVEAGLGTVHSSGDIGPESVPGDYTYQKPVLWGTNRQGPDLSHTSSRPYVNKAWHVEHLKDPRRLVPGSIMPSFAHLSPAELDALAEYLLTLR